MNRILLFTGKENNGEEVYQLLVKQNYYSYAYCGTDEKRHDFLEKVSNDFAERIASLNSSSNIGILKGFKIDESSGKMIRINPLEEYLVDNFSRQVTSKLTELKGKTAVIPAVVRN